MSSTLERAEQWIAQDPDPRTRDELRFLVEAARNGHAPAQRDVDERFAGPLEFGTAGLRGVLGAGESRMNLAVVIRTTLGLASYLLADPTLDAKGRGVAIGYDGRRQSREFAHAAVEVLAALGIPSVKSEGLCPTPLLAFAVTRVGAAAGIMVTASHNPAEYNGYKVYWGNGAQIIPPHDRGIARASEAAPPANAIARLPTAEARERGLSRTFPIDLDLAYLAGVGALSLTSRGDREAKIVYTPLHGVGNMLVREALRRAGFTRVFSVPEQAEPNGDFPTVAFPNPEEKGALDLSFALADRLEADLVLASDPDADRLAVAVRTTPASEGASPRFTQLTGNQVGVLLGHYLLKKGPQGDDRLTLASCVSSPQLGTIARALGVRYEETLTGFKWIANRALEIERAENKRFVFGYEEALGYTVGSLVRDKDGISAAALFAELWAVLRAEGRTVFDELETIARTWGCFVSSQLSVTLKGQEGIQKIQEVMGRLRTTPTDRFGPAAVVALSDVKTGTRRAADGTATSLTLPSSDVLIFELEGGSRVIARPSGTEPKLKIYFDVREEMSADEPLASAEQRANTRMASIRAAFCDVAGV
jgi:phosphomannomutase